jgi:hypothetical protein
VARRLPDALRADACWHWACGVRVLPYRRYVGELSGDCRTHGKLAVSRLRCAFLPRYPRSTLLRGGWGGMRSATWLASFAPYHTPSSLTCVQRISPSAIHTILKYIILQFNSYRYLPVPSRKEGGGGYSKLTQWRKRTCETQNRRRLREFTTASAPEHKSSWHFRSPGGGGGWGGWRRCVTSAFTCVHMCVHMCPNTCPGGGASMRHKGIPRTASSNSTAGYSCWEAQRVAMSAAQPPCSLSSCFCSSSSSAPRFLCVVGNKRQRGAQLSRNIPTGIWGRYV